MGLAGMGWCYQVIGYAEPKVGALLSDLPADFFGHVVIADVTLEELYLGTGIGLSVCLSLIAARGS